MITLALVTKLQPYKFKCSNAIDVILLLSLITADLSKIMHTGDSNKFPKAPLVMLFTVSALVPIICVFYLILTNASFLKMLKTAKVFV